MDRISIKGLEIFANHGVFKEETEKTTTAKTNKTSAKSAKTTKKIKSPNTGDISRPVMAMIGAAMLLTSFALCREKRKE